MSANETDAAPRKSQSEILEHKLNRMKFLTGLTDELYHDALSFRDVNRARLADDTPEMRIAKRRAYATISAIELNPKTAEKIYKDAAVLRTANQRYQAEANTPADPFVGETSTVAGEFSKDAQLMNMHDEKKWKEKENVALSGSANPLVSSWSGMLLHHLLWQLYNVLKLPSYSRLQERCISSGCQHRHHPRAIIQTGKAGGQDEEEA